MKTLVIELRFIAKGRSKKQIHHDVSQYFLNKKHVLFNETLLKLSDAHARSYELPKLKHKI